MTKLKSLLMTKIIVLLLFSSSLFSQVNISGNCVNGNEFVDDVTMIVTDSLDNEYYEKVLYLCSFNFKLEKNNYYTIKFYKNGYCSRFVNISTRNTPKNVKLIFDIELSKDTISKYDIPFLFYNNNEKRFSYKLK